MVYNHVVKKRTSWRWRDASQMDVKEIEINSYMKLRISLNRLSPTRVRPSYTLFFADGDESFHVNLANTARRSSSSGGVVRAPVLSKLGVLHTEGLAFESETAKEHAPESNQSDFTKNPYGERILQCINVSCLFQSRTFFFTFFVSEKQSELTKWRRRCVACSRKQSMPRHNGFT